jgi:TPR repeat protein
LRGAAYYFKLSADQGNAFGQMLYDYCLRDGQGISKDLSGAVHYFKLSADQGNADGVYHWGSHLTGMLQVPFNPSHYPLKITVHAVVGWMTDNGIGTSLNLAVAVQNSELSFDLLPNWRSSFG